MTYLEEAKRVIQDEINGLNQLLKGLDNTVNEVCDAIIKAKGRTIITGMGKSGHIGVKIAATLASTGTTSYFVHPAEAVHGDLGMITKDDIIIALSNSGNTAELAGIINYANKFNITLVGVTSNKESELAKASTFVLLLPKVKEACSLGLAPTVSTTNTLALGDAIAISILNARGFKEEDFNVFHPSGSLGNKLMKVKDIMHTNERMPLVALGTEVSKAIISMSAGRLGCVGVLDSSSNLVGLITDGDLRRCMSNDLFSKKVEDIMSTKFITTTQDTTAAGVFSLMRSNKITNIFVVEEKKPLGIIHIHDLIEKGV